MAPGWWNLATTELLSSLSAIAFPTAVLKPDRLSVTGLVTSEATAAMRLQGLRNVLPGNVTLDIRFETVATTATPGAMCARQFAVDPVRFEESGTEFRSSAYPVMDRIIALADACRDAIVTITGHTDSSGDENQNQQLSLARARAVAAYLGEMGIEPGRVNVAGAGSSLPVASNATRYGRSLNRRIDVRMTPGRSD